MATVRIYKVAELLGLSSQDAMSLLKSETGIEVKSASSSVEEIVARQFVEREARKRRIALPPPTALFADAPAPPKKGAVKAGAKAGKVVEPPKPAAPALRPRLVKTVKPAGGQPEDAHGTAPAEDVAAPPAPAAEPLAPVAEAADAVAAGLVAEPVAAPDVPEVAGVAAAEPAPAPAPTTLAPRGRLKVETEPPPVGARPTPTATVPVPPPARVPQAPAAVTPPAPPAISPVTKPIIRPGRVVPPSRRLRIEDPLTGEAPAARPMPLRPAVRPSVSAPAPTRPAEPGMAVRPGLTGRPIPAGPRPPLGGPRPLPSQPVRSGQPAGAPGSRPPFGQQRPGQSTYRPAYSGPRARGPRRDDRPSQAPMAMELPPITKLITLAEGMTVKDLADKLEVKAKDVLKKLMDRRMMMTINSTLDAETAQLVSRDFGAEVLIRSFEEEVVDVETTASKPEDMVERAPVVTVMGHVDHGKTTLLDAIRKAKVAQGEAGGITQHIGAYSVDVNKRRVVFLDTPGHAAFTMMRARGAKVTDIVILVVAADDGVMPQTKEAIDHAKAANVPIIVAVNKIDVPGANPERVKRELSELGLQPEEWGGTTVTVEVSAKQQTNLDQLLEMILLVADIGTLKANPTRMAQGTVLEAKLDKGRGPVATVLVQDGTIREGDLFIAGTVDGKVRALFDHLGRKIKSAGPATPVEILGLSALPSPGDILQVVDDSLKARQIVTYRQTQAKAKALGARGSRLTLESLQQQMAEGNLKELAIIIKADVQGSAEVLADTLAKLSDERVKVRIIHTGVGAINESDVLLASASDAVIIGFNVKPDRNAADVAEREEVEIRQHSVIYHVTDEIKKAMTGLLEPTLKEARIGAAVVQATFSTPKAGTVAGCMVTEGKITRAGDAQARLLRGGEVLWTGRISSLRRFKDDVGEVKSGMECGISLDKYNDIEVGDMIEVFHIQKIAAVF
ncbi:MAG: translation initiation factor IF-2 [Acidimicrobiia bacterium]|nr:translation initiation factor IF-2 [Acidimicrobiia bacterium]